MTVNAFTLQTLFVTLPQTQLSSNELYTSKMWVTVALQTQATPAHSEQVTLGLCDDETFILTRKFRRRIDEPY